MDSFIDEVKTKWQKVQSDYQAKETQALDRTQANLRTTPKCYNDLVVIMDCLLHGKATFLCVHPAG